MEKPGTWRKMAIEIKNGPKDDEDESQKRLQGKD